MFPSVFIASRGGRGARRLPRFRSPTFRGRAPPPRAPSLSSAPHPPRRFPLLSSYPTAEGGSLRRAQAAHSRAFGSSDPTAPVQVHPPCPLSFRAPTVLERPPSPARSAHQLGLLFLPVFRPVGPRLAYLTTCSSRLLAESLCRGQPTSVSRAIPARARHLLPACAVGTDGPCLSGVSKFSPPGICFFWSIFPGLSGLSITFCRDLSV